MSNAAVKEILDGYKNWIDLNFQLLPSPTRQTLILNVKYLLKFLVQSHNINTAQCITNEMILDCRKYLSDFDFGLEEVDRSHYIALELFEFYLKEFELLASGGVRAVSSRF